MNEAGTERIPDRWCYNMDLLYDIRFLVDLTEICCIYCWPVKPWNFLSTRGIKWRSTVCQFREFWSTVRISCLCKPWHGSLDLLLSGASNSTLPTRLICFTDWSVIVSNLGIFIIHYIKTTKYVAICKQSRLQFSLVNINTSTDYLLSEYRCHISPLLQPTSEARLNSSWEVSFNLRGFVSMKPEINGEGFMFGHGRWPRDEKEDERSAWAGDSWRWSHSSVFKSLVVSYDVKRTSSDHKMDQV